MTERSFNLSNSLAPVTLRLIIINVLIWLTQMVLEHRFGIDLTQMLGLHYFPADDFSPLQGLSYMFLHSTSGIDHLFFNMFSLWMFGSVIERFWGAKRYLFFYIACGLTAAIAQEIVWHLELRSILPLANQWIDLGDGLPRSGRDFLNLLVTIGASGSVFGLLLAFGMLFPNSVIYLFFLPIPIKAKYFVVIYGLVELFLGINPSLGSNVAHFAHLGGMIGGLILILLWRKKGRIDGPYN